MRRLHIDELVLDNSIGVPAASIRAALARAMIGRPAHGRDEVVVHVRPGANATEIARSIVRALEQEDSE